MIREYCLEFWTHYESESNSIQLDELVAWRYFKLLFPRQGPGDPDQDMYDWLWDSWYPRFSHDRNNYREKVFKHIQQLNETIGHSGRIAKIYLVFDSYSDPDPSGEWRSGTRPDPKLALGVIQRSGQACRKSFK